MWSISTWETQLNFWIFYTQLRLMLCKKRIQNLTVTNYCLCYATEGINNSAVLHNISTAVNLTKKSIYTGLILVQCKIFTNSNSELFDNMHNIRPSVTKYFKIMILKLWYDTLTFAIWVFYVSLWNNTKDIIDVY